MAPGFVISALAGAGVFRLADAFTAVADGFAGSVYRRLFDGSDKLVAGSAEAALATMARPAGLGLARAGREPADTIRQDAPCERARCTPIRSTVSELSRNPAVSTKRRGSPSRTRSTFNRSLVVPGMSVLHVDEPAALVQEHVEKERASDLQIDLF